VVKLEEEGEDQGSEAAEEEDVEIGNAPGGEGLGEKKRIPALPARVMLFSIASHKELRLVCAGSQKVALKKTKRRRGNGIQWGHRGVTSLKTSAGIVDL